MTWYDERNLVSTMVAADSEEMKYRENFIRLDKSVEGYMVLSDGVTDVLSEERLITLYRTHVKTGTPQESQAFIQAVLDEAGTDARTGARKKGNIDDATLGVKMLNKLHVRAQAQPQEAERPAPAEVPEVQVTSNSDYEKVNNSRRAFKLQPNQILEIQLPVSDNDLATPMPLLSITRRNNTYQYTLQLDGKSVKGTFAANKDGSFMVGRAGANQLQIPERYGAVSGNHLALDVTADGRLMVRDYSTNGTGVRVIENPNYVEQQNLVGVARRLLRGS